MIPRYSRNKLKKIWDPHNKFTIWLQIELLICEAQQKLGNIPKKSLDNIKKYSSFDIKRIDEIEKEVKHDVIAFLTNLSENIGEDSRYIHLGITSSDILDTCLSVQIKQSIGIIKKELKSFLSILKKQAKKYKNYNCIGRSHGIFAEPTTFGLKLLGKYCEFKRSYDRLLQAENEISICAISGAVGTFANVDPFVERYVSKKLGLKPELVSTQIIPRDRHAYLFSVLAVLAGSIENLSTEIRHLQRSEVREVEEYFDQNQKGSSAMPHKRNPVLSENLTGISRMIRNSVIPFVENITLWHERDISHSSVERVLCPDILILTDFAICRIKNIIDKLVVDKRKMNENLNNTKYLYNSQRVMLELVKKGLSRENSYKKVQKIAMRSWKTEKSFKELLLSDNDINSFLSKSEIEEIFDINYHYKNLNSIFKKVFK